MLPNAPMNEWQVFAAMCVAVGVAAFVLLGMYRLDQRTTSDLGIFTSLGFVAAAFWFLAACGIWVISLVNAIGLALGLR